MSTVIDQVIDEGDQLGQSRWLMRICRVWNEVVGPELAQDLQPDRFSAKDGVLYVACPTAMHAAALTPRLDQIRKDLNRKLGRHMVQRIRTRQASRFYR